MTRIQQAYLQAVDGQQLVNEDSICIADNDLTSPGCRGSLDRLCIAMYIGLLTLRAFVCKHTGGCSSPSAVGLVLVFQITLHILQAHASQN